MPRPTQVHSNNANRWAAGFRKLRKSIMQRKTPTVFATLIIFSLFATSCSTINAPLISTASYTPIPLTQIAVYSTPTPEIITTGIISPKEALEQMYGKDKIFSADGTKVMTTAKNGHDYWVEINSLVCFWELKLEKCIVITDWSEGICHICGVSIQGAVFERTHKGWMLRKFNSSIALLASSGYAPKGELIRIGDEKYAISFKTSYGNLGNISTSVIIIAETESSLGIVFQYYPTESKDNKWKYIAELNFYSDKKNIEYYKIVVTYFGTDKTGKTPPTQFYTFSGMEYVLVDEQK